MMQNNGPPARRVRIAATLVLALTLAVMLAGCGKKGNNEPPPGQPNTYPQAYPKQ